MHSCLHLHSGASRPQAQYPRLHAAHGEHAQRPSDQTWRCCHGNERENYPGNRTTEHWKIREKEGHYESLKLCS